MPIARTGYPLQQQAPRTRISTAARRQDWREWLRRWSAERRHARLQRLGDLWDAQNEEVWTQTAYSYRDFVLRESRPALRLAIYQHLAMS
jgi:hypothetical protein